MQTPMQPMVQRVDLEVEVVLSTKVEVSTSQIYFNL